MQENNSLHYYALTFVAADSKGLVAEAAKVFLDNGFNIADSSSTLLHGIFSMIFIVTSTKNYAEEEVKSMFKGVKIVPHVFKHSGAEKANGDVHYSLSIYGADKAGIVYETAASLAKNNVNIVDLQTRITGKQNSRVYIMMLDVTVAENDNQDKWQQELSETAKKIGTEINIKKIECYEL